MRNVADKGCRENQNTLFVLKKLFLKSKIYEIMRKKYCTAGQATDNIAHARCMLGN
jgi:hypothetical protein